MPAKPATPWLALLALMGLGTGLRAWRLGAAELWLDEACTLDFARLAPGDLVQTLLTTEGHPPVYYGLMSLLHALVGDALDAETVLRLPSLLAGVALIPLTFMIARRLSDDRTALAAAAMAALSPLGIYYSIEARHYALLAALGSGAWLGLERWLRTGDRRALAMGSLLLGGAAGSHFHGLFLVPIPLLWAAVAAPRDGTLRRRALQAQLVWGAVAVPVVALALSRLSGGNPGTAWLESVDPLSALWASLGTFAGGVTYPYYLGYLGLKEQPGWMQAGATSLFVLGILLAAAPDTTHGRSRRGALAGLIALLLIPAVISLVKPVYLPGRYELAAMPLAQALVVVGWARGLQRLAPPAWAAVGAGALALLLAVPSLADFVPRPTARVWSHVSERAQVPDEAPVICTGLTCPVVRWSLRQRGHTGSVSGFPAGVELHPCWTDPVAPDPGAVRLDAAAVVRKLSASDVIYVSGVFIEGTTRPDRWESTSRLFEALRRSGYVAQAPVVRVPAWIMRWSRGE
ncbi:MAG: mannosyltransferase [Myxococcota bacterium]